MKFKAKIITILFTSFILSAKLCATGAGIQAGGNQGLTLNQDNEKLEKFTGTLCGTMRFSRVPVAVGFGFETGKLFSDFQYGFSGFADYYALDLQLKNTWNLYSGFGASVSLLTSDFKNWNPAFGARFFVGTNWLLWDNYLEIYAQQNIVPAYCKKSFMLNLPLEAGVRMHF